MKKEIMALLVGISFVPPVIFAFCPVYEINWLFIGLSLISIVFLTVYMLNRQFRLFLETTESQKYMSSLGSFLIKMASFIFNYCVTLIVIIEASHKFSWNLILTLVPVLLISALLIIYISTAMKNFLKTL